MLINASTVDEIIECILDAHRRSIEADDLGSLPLLCFHWHASQIHALDQQLTARLYETHQTGISRFEYDYKSKMVFLELCETRLHSKVRWGLRDHIKDIQTSLAMANDSGFLSLLRSVDDFGSATISIENKLLKQPDISFAKIGALPSLVCEVS